MLWHWPSRQRPKFWGCILYTLLPIHVPSFMRLALIVFKLSKDPDFWRTDRLTELQTGRITDWRTDGGQTYSPLGVNTGSGLIEQYNMFLLSRISNDALTKCVENIECGMCMLPATHTQFSFLISHNDVEHKITLPNISPFVGPNVIFMLWQMGCQYISRSRLRLQGHNVYYFSHKQAWFLFLIDM